jgi:excisionase family DNA binding protein
MSSLLTIRQAAERLSLSESKVYRMTISGELPVQRIGRAVRIPESAINYLAEPNPLSLPSYLKEGKNE